MTKKEEYVLNHYEITDDGRVFSCLSSVNNFQRKELSKREDKDGYYDITLVCSENGNRQPFRLHRLVLLKYGKEIENYDIVNHIDLDKKNNHISNLEWSTVAKNTQHGYDNCTYTNVKKVKVTENDGNILVFPSQSHVARYYGYKNSATVNQILLGIRTNPIPRGKRRGLFFEYTSEGVTTIERNPNTVVGV
jgi:hypothetical protein